ncbi:MAG: serine/threonine-protein kinase [Xenococcaceae cyanobacterium MO_188.B19]|nr:serine/threonine-protein kinase [Xenococcaceae cyanobacterium MO_188.B19]
MDLLDCPPTITLPHNRFSAPIQKISHQEKISGALLNNRYVIQKVIGRGGIGLTYLALDSHRFNDVCVIKEFSPVFQETEQFNKLRDLFIREAKILYQLEHPQIPKFYACFETEERLFLVQEYIQGKSYSQLFQEKLKQGQTFSESEIIVWLRNVLPILEHIHQRGIVHRDISPDNIMESETGKLPILIDFGVGQQLNFSTQEIRDNSINQSHTPTLVGKIGYAPWEQLALGKCFPSSDLYSLGVTAIVLLTGKQPAELIDYSLEWQWRHHTKVSDAFAQIIEQFIAYNPQQRYQSAQEALTALNSLNMTSAKPIYFKSYFSQKQKIEKTKLFNSLGTSDTITAKFIKYCQEEYKFGLF